MQHGQEREMARRCLYAAARVWSPQAIAQWYISLWQTHNLAVKKGLLIPRKRITVGSALNSVRSGCELLDIHLKEKPDRDEMIGLAIKRWRGHNTRTPRYYQGVVFTLLIQAVDEGYWASYLLGIIGLAE